MNELVSMVVPLQTLPGWPVAPTVPWLHAIGLLIGLPLVAIIIVSTIGKVGAKVNAGRGHDFDDRFQLGRGSGGSGGAVGGSSSSAALPSGASGASSGAATGASTGASTEAGKVGGASARW